VGARLWPIVAGLVVAGAWSAGRPSFVHAQPAALEVVVQDETGGALRSAEVVVVPAVTGQPTGRRALVSRRTDARGEVRVAGLRPGAYTVEVAAAGFEPARLSVTLAPGDARRLVLRLALARRRETVVVAGTPPNVRGGLPRILTPADIAALPDDPEGLERVLRQMAGPGATIVVDGFRSAPMPHKFEIAFIEFRWSELSAELHEAGEVTIEITTRPGTDTAWGSFDATFAPRVAAAREPFAAAAGRTGSSRVFGGLGGPIQRNRSSISVYAGRRASRRHLPFTGVLPLADSAAPPILPDIASSEWFAQLRGTYRLSASALARVSSNLEWTTEADARGSSLDLPERAYTAATTSAAHRASVLWARRPTLVNEVRATLASRTNRWRPETTAPAVYVAGAFWAGGAQREGSRRAANWTLADDLRGQSGRHAWRVGVLVESDSLADEVAVNSRGTFLFSSVGDYLAGRPTRFSQRLGEPSVRVTTRRAGLFVQDDVTLRPNLELGLGLRWEREMGPGRLRGWAPRVRVTWTVRGATVSGGAGLYHEWVGPDVWQQAARLDGTRQFERLVFGPGFPDPGEASDAVVLPRSVVRLSPSLHLTRILRVVARVDRTLGDVGVLRVQFQENRTASALRSRDLNAPGADGDRPDPGWGVVTFVEAAGFRRARSLRVSFDRSTARPRTLLSAIYTLGSVVNDTDGPFVLPTDSRRPAADRGPGAGDVRHAVGGSLVRALSGAWSVVAAVALRSGAPYTLTTGRDDNHDGVFNDRPPGVSRNSARGAWHVTLDGQLVWTQPLARASRPASEDAPAGNRSQRRRITVRLEGQNLLNRVNPTSYVGVVSSPRFGQPVAAAPARRLEATVSLAW
jgi:hypothetical protein